MQKERRRIGLVFVVALVIGLTGSMACAAKGIRNQTRVAALAVGEAALALDSAERTVFAAGAYDAATHDRVGKAVLQVLYAARGFERAAAGWVEGVPASDTIDAARSGLVRALADFEKIVPAAGGAREPLLRALAAIRAALTPPSVAQLPVPGGGLLVLLSSLLGLAESVRKNWPKWRALLAKEGASDEDLAQLDAQLSSAIDARESEHGGSAAGSSE